jgi:hypothetical protein
MSGFDNNNSLVKSGKKGLTIADNESLSKSGKLGANQGTLTHVDHWGNLNPNITPPPPTSTWTMEDATVTKDLLALHPTAIGFEFVTVGGGAGGTGGYVRANVTQSMFGQPPGSGGGVSKVSLTAAQATGNVTITVGAGGSGGIGAIAGATALMIMGGKGGDGGTSKITIGGVDFCVATGGKGVATGSNAACTIWSIEGKGNFANGGVVQGVTAATATINPTGCGAGSCPPVQATGYTTSSFELASNIPAWSVVATGPGSGGVSGGHGTSATSVFSSQAGQKTTNNSISGAAGASSNTLTSPGLGAGNGNDGTWDATNGITSFGTGGGGGGSASQSGFQGNFGGIGGFPGAGGGAGGNGTWKSNVATFKMGGDGGNGGKGCVLWRPIF